MARASNQRLYFWVLAAVIAGAVVGAIAPDVGISLKPLGDGFIRLIRMVVGPIVFGTVVLGIANARDLRQVGRIGAKALVYFEVVSTIALVLGLAVALVFKPGDGFHADASHLDATAVARYATAAHEQSFVDFLINIIPTTFFSAFISGELLPVLLCAVLVGVAAAAAPDKSGPVVALIDSFTSVMFRIVSYIMWLAPVGAFGAMAFTLGKFGLHGMVPLARFMGFFYLTCAAFIAGVLGLVARLAGFSVFALIRYLRTEILTVIGTSSSESVLAPLIARLESLGAKPSTVGVVVPTGYSFNLDGTNIYLSLGAIFLAQALDVPITLHQQIMLVLVAMLSSKGAATVTGGGFITLAATLAVVPSVPVAALALILGIDRFMSEARAVTNLIGNAVATLVIARWEGELDAATLRARLRSPAR